MRKEEISKRVSCIKELLEKYESPKTFKRGDVVRQVRGLDSIDPSSADYSVVVCMLDEPVFDNTVGRESPAFHEPLDMVIAATGAGMGEDHEWLALMYVDSKRFEVVNDM